LGLTLQVRRFVKYNLGEGLEKKSNDFAAEVAQQTQKKEDKPAAAPAAKEQPKQQVGLCAVGDCEAFQWAAVLLNIAWSVMLMHVPASCTVGEHLG
jgi:hypothetical protein